MSILPFVPFFYHFLSLLGSSNATPGQQMMGLMVRRDADLGPPTGLQALASVLVAIGLPVEAIAIVAGVDAFMDMGRTAVNVFGNTVAVKLVQKLGGRGLTDSDLPPPVVGARTEQLVAVH